MLAAALTLGGCAPADDATESPPAVTIPDTPVGSKTQWILEVLGAEHDTVAAEWERELDQAFLDQVSADELATLLNQQIRPARPFVVTAYRESGDQAVTTVRGELGEPFNLTLALNSEGLISGMFFGQAAEP